MDGAADLEAAFRQFVDAYRARCLWSYRPDYYLETLAERERVLRLIEQHGDLEAFQRVAEFRQWLQSRSSAVSSTV